MSAERQKKYVLDTSALLAYYQDEDGADQVEQLFTAATRGEAALYVSFMTVFEIAYLAAAQEDLDEATKLVLRTRELGLEEVWPDETVLWQAAAIKAGGGVSVADAFIAGLSAALGATLVHRDPEYVRLAGRIDQMFLGESES